MKKVALLALLICICVSSYGQMRNLRLGISGEPLSYSWMESNTPLITSEGGNLTSSVIVKVEYYISPYISIASGLGITANQGGRLVYSEGGDVWADSALFPDSLHSLPVNTTIRSRIQYFELPVALKFRTDEFGRIRIFFEIPRITLGITSKAEGEAKFQKTEITDQNIFPSMSWFNVSYGTMGGIEYSINENISGYAGLHWKQGFVDLTDDSGVDYKITSGTFGLQIGVLF